MVDFFLIAFCEILHCATIDHSLRNEEQKQLESRKETMCTLYSRFITYLDYDLQPSVRTTTNTTTFTIVSVIIIAIVIPMTKPQPMFLPLPPSQVTNAPHYTWNHSISWLQQRSLPCDNAVTRVTNSSFAKIGQQINVAVKCCKLPQTWTW